MGQTKEIRPYKNKGTCLPLETDDMTAILNMAIQASVQRGIGRPSDYPNTRQGIEQFKQTTIEYFEYVNGVNQNPNLERKLIPDIENWAMYLGITRRTIIGYENRNLEWAEMIGFYKNAIASVKKQLAMNYKIPPMVYVFDATNNHGYVNSNEFKLTATNTQHVSEDTTALEREIQSRGLVWDEEKGEFVPQ